jgi:hypothetical protein
MNKYKTVFLALLLLLSILLPAACSSWDKNTKGPTAIVIDDETGRPIEGAVAIAIWRGKKKDCTIVESLESACWGFRRAEETVSDKDGRIAIPDFWKTTKGKGGTGSIYDPRLTVYKFGYVCWDQQRIFHPKSSWEDRKDFNRDNRIVRLKKWQIGLSLEEHSMFIRSVTRGDEYKTKDKLFINEPWPQENRTNGVRP